MRRPDTDDPTILALLETYDDAPRGSEVEAAALQALCEALHRQLDHVEFDVTDRFGRRIGACVETWQSTSGGVTTYWALPSATRAGRCYGATQRPRSFASEVERAKWQETYITQARKRAEKRRGK